MRRLDRLSPTELKVLFGGTLAVWGVIALLGCLLGARRVLEVSGALREEQRLLATERRLARGLTALVDQHEKVSGDVGSLEPSVAPKQFLPTLITQLAELAGQHELVLVGVTPDPLDRATPAGEPVRHRLVATFAGRYAGLLSLLEAFSQAPKALSVRAVDIRTQPDATDGQTTAAVTLLAFETPGVPDPSASQPVHELPWALLGDGAPPAGADALPPAPVPAAAPPPRPATALEPAPPAPALPPSPQSAPAPAPPAEPGVVPPAVEAPVTAAAPRPRRRAPDQALPPSDRQAQPPAQMRPWETGGQRPAGAFPGWNRRPGGRRGGPGDAPADAPREPVASSEGEVDR